MREERDAELASVVNSSFHGSSVIRSDYGLAMKRWLLATATLVPPSPPLSVVNEDNNILKKDVNSLLRQQSGDNESTLNDDSMMLASEDSSPETERRARRHSAEKFSAEHTFRSNEPYAEDFGSKGYGAEKN